MQLTKYKFIKCILKLSVIVGNLLRFQIDLTAGEMSFNYFIYILDKRVVKLYLNFWKHPIKKKIKHS